MVQFNRLTDAENAGTHFFVMSVEWNNGRVSSASWVTGTFTPAPGMTTYDVFESLVQHLLDQRNGVFARPDMRLLQFDVRPNVIVPPVEPATQAQEV